MPTICSTSTTDTPSKSRNGKKNGKARVFYRGTVWDAKPEKGSPMVPGLWEIVGMSGNTLIIKLKQGK